MNYTIHDLPVNVRPRERLLKFGAKSLADYELLAIILRTGTKEMSVLELSKKLLIEYGNIGALSEITPTELMNNKGIKEAKAIEILAAVEIGIRVCTYTKNKLCIQNSHDLYLLVRYEMENLSHEEMHAVYLDIRGNIIENRTISKGSVDTTTADPKEIAKWALKLSSHHFILIHNHPSGDPTPSYADSRFTNDLAVFCEKMGIKLLDHIIIGKNKYYTFNQKKVQT